jgi:hypothetical protein
MMKMIPQFTSNVTNDHPLRPELRRNPITPRSYPIRVIPVAAYFFHYSNFLGIDLALYT